MVAPRSVLEGELPMKSLLVTLSLAGIVLAATPAPATAADAAYHHVHLTAPSPEDAAQWYIKHMGCEPLAPRKDAAKCGTVQLLFYRRAPKGASEGTGMHHIGFSFLNLAEKMKQLEANGVKIVTPMREGRLKAGFVEDPWGTRIELVEDAESLGFYHVHLHTPDPDKTLKWYQNAFGGQLLKRKLTGVDGLLYGTFWVLATKPADHELPLQPTDGRAVDHLGFSFTNLDASVVELKGKGVKFREEVRSVTNPAGQTLKIAFVIGPDDVVIELVQPPPQ
jgi:catechol 2,3-dioxygenase-like lactoylglutathione lyase family enzyme